MIEIKEISKNAQNYHSVEEFYEKHKTAVANSYDDYINNGHSWCWSLVGNIVEKHEHGEEHEIKSGTKHFTQGTKVYLAPIQWGDGYENVVVIGLPRHGRKYIEVITRSIYVENYRMQKVYKPAVLKLMCNSKYRWWNDTENDRKEIIKYLEGRAPEEAERQRILAEQLLSVKE